MRIVCISDIHGCLIEGLPKADLCIIAGDLCPTISHNPDFQCNWMTKKFNQWCLDNKQIGKFVVIAGNHDFLFEKYGKRSCDTTGFKYLQDEAFEYKGLKIWGTPHTKIFYNWSFNLSEEDLAKKWELIPSDANIIVCHGPAYGFNDLVSRHKENDNDWPFEHTGSPSMLEKVKIIEPLLYIHGHIHSGYGVRKFGKTYMVNASYVNEQYKPANKPIIFDYDEVTKTIVQVLEVSPYKDLFISPEALEECRNWMPTEEQAKDYFEKYPI